MALVASVLSACSLNPVPEDPGLTNNAQDPGPIMEGPPVSSAHPQTSATSVVNPPAHSVPVSSGAGATPPPSASQGVDPPDSEPAPTTPAPTATAATDPTDDGVGAGGGASPNDGGTEPAVPDAAPDSGLAARAEQADVGADAGDFTQQDAAP